MSTDSALHPLHHLLTGDSRSLQADPPGVCQSAVSPAGGLRPFAVRVPAATQLLLARTAQALAVGGVRRHWLLFALTACLFGVIVPTEIAYASEMWVSRTIAGIPPHYALTAFAVLLAWITDGRYLRQLLKRPAVVFYLACLAGVTAVGLFRNGYNGHIVRADLYLVRWFFVGFLLMRLAIVSGCLRQYLIVAAIVILATAAQIDIRNTMGWQTDTARMRMTSVDFWPVINLGTIMLGLLITTTWPRGIVSAGFGSSAFALLFLLGSIRSSTRSLFIIQVFCFLLCLLALSRDPRMRGRGGELRRVLVVIVLLGAVWLAYLVATGKILGDVTQLGTRFTAEARERFDTGTARLNEARGLLEQMSMEDWFFGMGLGGMFYNTMGYWASSPHIAILGWLQKGGVFIFLVAIWTLYLRPAAAFVRAAALPRRDAQLPVPILVVGPPLLAWACLTFMSGGLDIGSFLGIGGLSALWLQLADDERRFAAARATSAAWGR